MLARRSGDVAGEACGRAERAGLGADVSLRGRAFHAVAERAVNARDGQRITKDIRVAMAAHVCEELKGCVRSHHVVARES